MTYFEIKNDWDDKTFCGLDLVWVNDGRASACFKTRKEVQDAMGLMPEEDRARCTIETVIA